MSSQGYQTSSTAEDEIPIVYDATRYSLSKTGVRAVAFFTVCALVALSVAVALVSKSDSNDVVPTPPIHELTCDVENGAQHSDTGMVSTTHYLATQAGKAILEQGGNAADASAAIQLVLNVVQPQSTGIGGGCFIMAYHAAGEQVYAIDGREEAPALMHPNSFCNTTVTGEDCTNTECECISQEAWEFTVRNTGGQAIGVPGVIHAVDVMLNKFGTMTFSEVAQPAIQLARTGFPLSEHLHTQLTNHYDRIIHFPATVELFLDPDTQLPPAIGTTMYNPDLADTLEALGDDPVEEFYRGQLAQDIVRAAWDGVNPVSNVTSQMQLSDLDAYRAVFRQPLHTVYSARDKNGLEPEFVYDVYGIPTPSSGGMVIGQALSLLQHSQQEYGTVDYWHRLIDAQDIAFSDRNMWMGDADFVDVPMDGLMDADYLEQRARDLFRVTHSAFPVSAGTPPGAPTGRVSEPPQPKKGTTHFSVIDQWDNVVSFTTTIENNLGSGVTVAGRGFLLNNELTDFTGLGYDFSTTPPTLLANRPEGGKRPRRTALDASDQLLEGGKRPMSAMAPTIVMRRPFHSNTSAPFLAMGSPGGSRIPGTVLNVLLPLLNSDGAVGLQNATDLPRVVSRNDRALAESALYEDDDITEVLLSRGFIYEEYTVSNIAFRPLGFVQTALKLGDGKGVCGSADITRLSTASAEGV